MPQQESRVKKTLLNARVNLIFYMLTLCLSFFSRKIFLDCLGADFVGLTGTLQNLLGFLNLAELGIGSAIGYLLYKPLYDHDQQKISEIISVMGYLYRWIGLIILGGGVILSCFLPWIFPDSDTGFHLPLIYFAFYSFLGSSLIGYFINYRQNLLGADQRNYVVTAYFQSATIIKTLIQMALAYYTGNYYLWVVVEFTFGIIHSIILNWKINKTYPWLRANIAQGRKLFKKYPEVMIKTRQLFVQKMCYFVQYQTTPFLIYAFVNLKIVAFYGNYTIITDKIGQLINTFMESTGASIGNLIAEGNHNKIQNLFWELLSMRYFIAGTVSYVLYHAISPFISLWLGNEYILPQIIILLVCINIFIGFTRGGVMQFLFGYGLFYDIWAPAAEIIINLSVAIIGGYFCGLPGVLMGGIVAQLMIVFIWKPIFLFTKGFKTNAFIYFKRLIIILFCILLSWGISNKISNTIFAEDYINGFFNWIIYTISNLILSVTTILFFMLIFTNGMRQFILRFINFKH